MVGAAVRGSAAAVAGALLLVGAVAGAAHAEVGDGSGNKPTRMTLCSGVRHDITVAATQRDWAYGKTTTLQPGQCVTTTGKQGQEGFVEKGGPRTPARYVWTSRLDTGMYLGYGFRVNAHNPSVGVAYASLSRYGEGSQVPTEGTRTEKYTEYWGWYDKTLEIDGLHVNTQWLGERDGYKDWLIRVV